MTELEAQLGAAVTANQCEALTCNGIFWVPGGRCPNLNTRRHGSRHLCWTHRQAADNATRAYPLKFVESK